MAKRIGSTFLAVIMLVCMIPLGALRVDARVTITSCAEVSGSDFTGNAALAQKLDSIFAGNANIYYNSACTKPVNTALGTSNVHPDTDVLYVGPYGGSYLDAGWSCWIYANGAYFTMFGESLGHGEPGPNSESIDLSTTSNKKLTYANLRSWGVSEGVGAQVRVGNHSIIILGYDSTSLTYLDGNGDGNGLVAVRIRSWSEVQSSSSTNGTVRYIVQPKRSYMDRTYPGHDSDYLGLCTAYPSAVRLRMTDSFDPRTLPCDADTARQYSVVSDALKGSALSEGDGITATGLYQNTAGEYWYEVTLKDGTVAYIDSSACCMETVVAPWIENGSFPAHIYGTTNIQGTVKTGGNTLETVQGVVYRGHELSGSAVLGSDVVSVDGESYSLKSSTVDKTLPFRKLADAGKGYYTLAFLVEYSGYYVENGQMRSFDDSGIAGSYYFCYGDVDENCRHSYRTRVVAPTCSEDGYTSYTCELCGYGYISGVTAAGHQPGEAVTENGTENGYDTVVYCTICGEELSRVHVDGCIPGDINSDGSVNNKDLTRLFQYLSDYDVQIDPEIADVNGDGCVNNKDLTRLFQYLSGHEVVIE